jgi:hypothetical protein
LICPLNADTHAAVGAEVPRHGDQLGRDPCLGRHALRTNGIAGGVDQDDSILVPALRPSCANSATAFTLASTSSSVLKALSQSAPFSPGRCRSSCARRARSAAPPGPPHWRATLAHIGRNLGHGVGHAKPPLAHASGGSHPWREPTSVLRARSHHRPPACASWPKDATRRPRTRLRLGDDTT